MINFENYLNLPLIWGGIIALAIFLYVFLDGFDLGVAILFPFAPTHDCRDKMMYSIAPFWDGNETWLVLGGGGLLAAFPLAYSVIMPAFYIPITIMLLGLIFRGVAFEFRFKEHGKLKKLWDYSFHFGSIAAVFCQGLILGGFVQGIQITGRSYSGSSFDWLSPFSIMTGIALLFGYALLGATWLIMKTEGETQEWARKTALYVLMYVMLFMGIVSLWIPFLNPLLRERWFSIPNIAYLTPLPILTIVAFYKLTMSIMNGDEILPFVYSISIFILGYIGIAVSFWPWIVPYSITLYEAAAAHESLSLLLIGTALLLPFVLGYTAYSYYVFRGKTTKYHIY